MTDTPTPTPPFRWLARLLLRGERGDVILGDLEEGYHRRLADGASRLRAAHWLLTHTLRSAVAIRRDSGADAIARQESTTGIRWTPSGGDIGFAMRSLWRRPGFTLPVVVTLALGIGVSATVFSVVEAVLLRQPAFHDPDQLVMVWNQQLEDADSPSLFSGPDFFDVRAQASTLAGVAALSEVVVAPVVGTAQPSFARLAPVSANLFDVLGVRPVLGRILEDADQAPLPAGVTVRPPNPVVLSHAYWERMFDADPAVIGRTIRTFTSDNVIVGVLPPDFSLLLPAAAQVGDDLGSAIDMWETYRADYSQWDRNDRGLRVIARITDGATLDDARAELDVIAARSRASHPEHERQGFALDIEALLPGQSRHLRPLLLLLSIAVLCVLAVACVNVSGLLLARTAGRHEELAIRTALGANRATLARLILLESLVLAAVGGALGLAVAAGGMSLLAWLDPAGLPQAGQLRLNRPVLAFAMLTVPCCAVLAGLIPTLRVAVRGGASLGARGATAPRTQRRLAEALVATQIALTVMLLVGSALMLRSFWRLQEVPLGFSPESVLTVDISTVGQPLDRSRPEGFPEWIARRRSQERILSESLQDLAGVRAAGAVFPVPLNGVYARTTSYSLSADGRDVAGVAYFRNVWPGYFEAMAIPLLGGRDFTYDDDQEGLGEWGPQDDTPRTDSPRVIIDARLAERLWPGERAVGQRLTFSIYVDVPHDAEVIGVVPFVPQGTLEDRMETIYIPRSYYRSQELTLTVRLASDSGAARQRIVDAVHAVFPDSPVGFQPMATYVGRALAPTRFVLTLLGAFALTALVLASIGLYGSMVVLVRTRTREIGVRLAMGALPRSISANVLARSALVGLAGVSVGLAGAGALSGLLASSLYEIAPLDPAAFTIAAMVQLGVACLAGWGPARRAAAIDPVAALRNG